MAGEKKRRQRKLVTATNLACCARPRRRRRVRGCPNAGHPQALRTLMLQGHGGWPAAPGWLFGCSMALLSPCAPSLGGLPLCPRRDLIDQN